MLCNLMNFGFYESTEKVNVRAKQNELNFFLYNIQWRKKRWENDVRHFQCKFRNSWNGTNFPSAKKDIK